MFIPPTLSSSLSLWTRVKKLQTIIFSLTHICAAFFLLLPTSLPLLFLFSSWPLPKHDQIMHFKVVRSSNDFRVCDEKRKANWGGLSAPLLLINKFYFLMLRHFSCHKKEHSRVPHTHTQTLTHTKCGWNKKKGEEEKKVRAFILIQQLSSCLNEWWSQQARIWCLMSNFAT